MKLDFLTIFFSFACFSISGWLLEVSYRSMIGRRFVNPGLLKGPYLILYGTGAMLLMASASLLQGSGLPTKALVYFVVTTGLELGSGFIAGRLFHTRLWDYSDQRFNYKGHICLKFSIYWIFLAFAFEYLVLPPYNGMLNLLPPLFKSLFAVTTLSLILTDCLIISIRQVVNMTAEEKILMDRLFLKTAKPILELPEVATLSQYNHHKGKTRLDHVKEVAFLSFLWAERFSLDGRAIIRGALLHDLFHYDWLYEGPRLHGFRHPDIALKNACKITCLSKKEKDIIKKHMWPLTVVPPRYMESLIVSLVDTFCSTRDYLRMKKHGKITAADAASIGSKAVKKKKG